MQIKANQKEVLFMRIKQTRQSGQIRRTKTIKQKVALLLVVLLMVSAWPGVGFGNMLPITQAMIIEKQLLTASGKMSNDYLDHTIINLIDVSSGSVTTYTYTGNNEDLTINNYSVEPQDAQSAGFKITPFIFQLTNQYRPDTEISVSGITYEQTVSTYTYGALKHEAMLSILSGLPDCLNNEPVHRSSGGSSWAEKYTPENMTKTVFTSFVIGVDTYTVKDGDTKTVKTMDVAPYVKNDRTYMPVRYVANSLGVPDENISWDDPTQTVTMTKDSKAVKLTIGDPVMLVNDKKVKMDVVPEIVPPGRTMLPLRYVAEGLGADVEWNEENQEVIITQEIEQGLQ
jgi:uncharacterized Zn ribbon protein